MEIKFKLPKKLEMSKIKWLQKHSAEIVNKMRIVLYCIACVKDEGDVETETHFEN